MRIALFVTGTIVRRLTVWAVVWLGLAFSQPALAQFGIATQNITGTISGDALGSPFNPVQLVTLPPGATVTGIGWNVTQTSYTPSWISEMSILFSDSTVLQSFSLMPGAGSNFTGQASFSSGGIISLSTLGIPNLVLPNGMLRLEFYETFDDAAFAADGIWQGTVLANDILQSTLSIQYTPTPGTTVMLTFGIIHACRRRRS